MRRIAIAGLLALAATAAPMALAASPAGAGGGSCPDQSSEPSLLVCGLYFQFLDRSPSADEQSYWLGVFGANGPLAVTVGIGDGDESHARTIESIYDSLLGRAVDPGGLAFWLGQMRGVRSFERLVAGILDSAEYQAGVDTSEIVATQYFMVLGRAPDDAGEAYWNGLVEAGQLTYGGVYDTFTRSAEGTAREIGEAYQSNFLRDPEPGATEFWTPYLRANGSLELDLAIVATPEGIHEFVTG